MTEIERYRKQLENPWKPERRLNVYAIGAIVLCSLCMGGLFVWATPSLWTVTEFERAKNEALHGNPCYVWDLGSDGREYVRYTSDDGNTIMTVGEDNKRWILRLNEPYKQYAGD